MSAVTIAWATLEQEGRHEAGWHVRRVHPDARCEILAGVHQPDQTPGLILELRVGDVPAGIVLPRSNGFSIEPVLLGAGSDARVRYALTLSDRGYAAVFSVLCEDVAATAARANSPRGALRDWVTRLHVWQAFMAQHGPGGLPEAAVLGLMGELLVLRDELIPLIGVRAALDAWSGPFGEANDFALPGGFLEVKTTSRQAPEVLEIANAAQLDDDRGAILLLHVRLRPDPNGLSLPSLVSEVRALILREAAERIPDYDNLLMTVGYVEAHNDLYTAAFIHQRTEIYRVNQEFPRIKRSAVPTGIRNCSYSIDLAACEPYGAPRLELAHMTRGDSTGG